MLGDFADSFRDIVPIAMTSRAVQSRNITTPFFRFTYLGRESAKEDLMAQHPGSVDTYCHVASSRSSRRGDILESKRVHEHHSKAERA